LGVLAAGAAGRCRLSALLNSCQPPFGIQLGAIGSILPAARLPTLSRRSAVDPL
jgi:hypothetical protein